MGSRVQALDARHRARLLEPGELHRGAEPVPPRPRARDPPRLLRGRRRHGGNQHVRRQHDHPGRVRPARPGVRDQQDRRRAGARGRRDVLRRAAPLRARQHRARAPSCRRWATSPTTRSRRRIAEQCRGLDGRRGRRHPDRNLPGHAADQGRGERRQAGARARPEPTRPSSCRSPSRPPAPCWSGPTSPPPRPSSMRSTCRYWPQLRHRAAGDGRARALARRQLARPAVDAAQCGPAGAGGRQDPLPARPGFDGVLDRALRVGGRLEPGRRLLRHVDAAHPGARRDAAADRRAANRPTPVARKPVWVPSVASLYGQTALRQENSYFSIGERCNANGSKKWRELQEKGDWDGCVAVAREQVAEGSNSLDVCTAFVGRDEIGR